MKKFLLLFAMLLSFGIVSAQTDKATSKAEAKMEKKEKAKKADATASMEKRKDHKMAPKSTTETPDPKGSDSREPVIKPMPTGTVTGDTPMKRSNDDPEYNEDSPTPK